MWCFDVPSIVIHAEALRKPLPSTTHTLYASTTALIKVNGDNNHNNNHKYIWSAANTTYTHSTLLTTALLLNRLLLDVLLILLVAWLRTVAKSHYTLVQKHSTHQHEMKLFKRFTNKPSHFLIYRVFRQVIHTDLLSMRKLKYVWFSTRYSANA